MFQNSSQTNTNSISSCHPDDRSSQKALNPGRAKDDINSNSKKDANENNRDDEMNLSASEGTIEDGGSFPILLHKIVSDPETDHCVHWLKGGTHFIIKDKKRFTKEILDVYYHHTKFASFIRRLKRWGFQRVPSGPLIGAYYNPNFVKGDPGRASLVLCNPQAMLSREAIKISNANSRVLAALSNTGALSFDGAGLGFGLGLGFNNNMMIGDSLLNQNGVNPLLGQGLNFNLSNYLVSTDSTNALLQQIAHTRGMQNQLNSNANFSNFLLNNGINNSVYNSLSTRSIQQQFPLMGVNANGLGRLPLLHNGDELRGNYNPVNNNDAVPWQRSNNMNSLASSQFKNNQSGIQDNLSALHSWYDNNINTIEGSQSDGHFQRQQVEDKGSGAVAPASKSESGVPFDPSIFSQDDLDLELGSTMSQSM
ncbi:hypothetical protein ACHAXS_003073 [Conticribra weissflogii]